MWASRRIIFSTYEITIGIFVFRVYKIIAEYTVYSTDKLSLWVKEHLEWFLERQIEMMQRPWSLSQAIKYLHKLERTSASKVVCCLSSFAFGEISHNG